MNNQHYFITSRIDRLTSAIELSAMERVRLFNEIGTDAQIITRDPVYNMDDFYAGHSVKDKVVNLYGYFQEQSSVGFTAFKLEKFPTGFSTGVWVRNEYLVDHKVRIRLNFEEDYRYLKFVDWLDQYGFTNRRDFYDNNRLSMSEYFDDTARLIVKQFWNGDGSLAITEYFHGGSDNQPVRTEILLNQYQRRFDNQDQLMAFLLDELAQKNECSFYSDREEIAVPAFKIMQNNAKRYIIVHSIFTQDATNTGEPYYYFNQAFKMVNKIKAYIVSTPQEATDLKSFVGNVDVLVIPVSFVKNNYKLAGNKRITGKIIAVARVTPLKQLDHVIRLAVRLHQIYEEVTLNIYGYGDLTEMDRLKQLVSELRATSYIEFSGYKKDLKKVYQTADLMVLTSRYEGFSMAVLEALSNGCPVVSYDMNYGPNTMIEPHHNGDLVRRNDQIELFEKVQELFNNRQLLQSYQTHANDSLGRYQKSEILNDWRLCIEV